MTVCDVIVIGGGPAGLMAAGQAAEMGAAVLLIEKMDKPGRKLRITGKGRCNLTNSRPLDEFLPHFGLNGAFLRSAFGQFFNAELIDFLARQGIATVTERGERVFPASNDAQQVADRLVRWVQRCGVRVWTGARVERLIVAGGCVSGVALADGREHHARAVIVATGGASYPGTGSTGDGFRLAEAVGHSVVPIRPALVPLNTAGDVAPRLEGLSLRNVEVTLWVDGKQAAREFGEMLFTHFGVSGPVILTLSGRAVVALHDRQHVRLSIDLKPALDESQLDARLLRDLDAHGKRHVSALLKGLLPHKLIAVCCDLTGLDPAAPCHQVTREQRLRLRAWLKDFSLEVTGHLPLAAAIITAGGVDLRQVDPRTMQSRLVAGLYFAGEVLDLAADTGGYNLQAAFSTGWLAGRSAAGSG